jgi:uncharacterized repeat protein (TIGR01451 family)
VGDTTVRFTVKNIGDAPTQAPHEYQILQNFDPYSANTFSLNAQESFNVFVPSNGETWFMQATKFDDGTLTYVAIEGCSGLTPGLINAFAADAGPAQYDFGCRQVNAAYDPNLKSAIPTGIGPDHLLPANQPLTYTIQFQNTGTDTAYRVLLVDRLSPHLDLNTFRRGLASHPHTWEINGDTLKVLFQPIALPDSNANEAASHGFFSFSIAQQPDLPDGVSLENTASIIFDFNPPIVTNTVAHTIGELTVRVDEPLRRAALWRVWGNPLHTSATFRTEQFVPGDKVFDLYDALGRPVRRAQFAGQVFEFQRGALPGGLYLFSIRDAQGRRFSGKIVLD